MTDVTVTTKPELRKGMLVNLPDGRLGRITKLEPNTITIAPLAWWVRAIRWTISKARDVWRVISSGLKARRRRPGN